MTAQPSEFPVRFRAGDGDPVRGPLTWGQRFMWDIIVALRPNDAFINQHMVVPVPPGRTTAGVGLALAALIERHAALRTRCDAGDDGEPWQEELAAGALGVRRVATDEDGLTQCASALTAELRNQSFDLAAGPPLRAGCCFTGEEPRVIVLVISHIATDAMGLHVLRRDLANLMREPSAGAVRGLAGAAVRAAHRPLVQAGFERSAAGTRIERAALARWRASLMSFPRTMFDLPPCPAARPRYWQGQLSSAALGLAVTELMRRHRSWSNSVVLAALALFIGHLTGRDSIALTVRVDTRFTLDLEDAVGCFMQEVPVTFDIDPRSFSATVRAVQNESLRAVLRSRCSPAAVLDVRDRVDAERGTRVSIDTMINTIRVTPEEPAALPASAPELKAEIARLRERTAFTWAGRRETEAIKLLLDSRLPAGNSFAVLADTVYLPPDDIRALMTGMEDLLIHAATAGDDPREPLLASGLAPRSRGASWHRSGPSWVDLERTAETIAALAEVGTEAVVVRQDDGLTARISAPVAPGRFDELPGRCLSALAEDETIAVPDRFVLVPGDPDGDTDGDPLAEPRQGRPARMQTRPGR